MSINFNHTIVCARDSKASAVFLQKSWACRRRRSGGHSKSLRQTTAANVDFMNADGEITPQHYAFLVSESEFDGIFDRIRERFLSYWADPAQH